MEVTMSLALAFMSIFAWTAFVGYIIGKNIISRIEKAEKEILQQLNFMEMRCGKEEGQ
jgi:uncharacterized membrane protein